MLKRLESGWKAAALLTFNTLVFVLVANLLAWLVFALMPRDTGPKLGKTANRERNSGIYLLMVATRHPERWLEKFPSWLPVEELGEWIGATTIRRLRSPLSRLRRSAGLGR